MQNNFVRSAHVTTLTALASVLFLTGCTYRIGSLTRLGQAPAPTAIPLQVTADPAALPNPAPPEKPIALPPGFSISVFASGLENPRMMAVGPDGQLYVAERGAGRVVRLPDRDGDGLADGVEVAAENMASPSSIDFAPDGSLYVGLTRRVLRFSDPDSLGAYQTREILIDNLPVEGHNTRTVLLSPDGSDLFVSIGSSCNVCNESDPRRAAILRYDPDGRNEQIYAEGLRNAVGITFRPGTGELWASNNGRDMLGDNLPPDDIYHVEQGQDYGWPRCHSGRIVDPEFGDAQACQGVGAPAVELQAHSAPLGLTFYTGDQFPQEYQGDLFVAYHGSWNRSTPTGYKVVRIPIQAGKAGPAEDFAVGWLVGGQSWGRPVDVVTGSDGSLYVSDDGGGNIYRIAYHAPQ